MEGPLFVFLDDTITALIHGAESLIRDGESCVDAHRILLGKEGDARLVRVFRSNYQEIMQLAEGRR